jgi:calcium-dependent protein kinase
VRLAVRKSDKVQRAVKSFWKASPSQRLEAEVLRFVDHPHIVTLQETFEDEKQTYLVQELCEGGELFDQLFEAPISERTAGSLFPQMVYAVQYLHGQRIVHRDLKPENWLLAQKGPLEGAVLKLVDFGTAVPLPASGKLFTTVGTPHYMAPEMVKGAYTSAVDYFALGVTLYAMLTTEAPFPGDGQLVVANAATMGIEWPSDAAPSDKARALVEKLLSREPSTRTKDFDAVLSKWLATCGELRQEARLETSLCKKLMSFRQSTVLEKAALTVCAQQLTASRRNDLARLFAALDVHQNGVLSQAEVKTAFEREGLPVPPELLEQWGRDADIDYTEFLASLVDRRRDITHQICWDAFRQLDLDGSGAISYDELTNLFVRGGFGSEEELAKIKSELVAADTNGDGEIDFDEFVKIVQHVELKSAVEKRWTKFRTVASIVGKLRVSSKNGLAERLSKSSPI